jgi:hypothetical protein
VLVVGITTVTLFDGTAPASQVAILSHSPDPGFAVIVVCEKAAKAIVASTRVKIDLMCSISF